MVGPIQYDDEITGAILSYSGVKSSIILEQKKSQDIYHKGYIAHHDFSYIKSEEPKMKECIELGKKYAISNYPVLIYGEEGTEREILAECIHNNSARKSFPFVSINCSKMNDIDQYNYLFGNSHATNEKDKTNGIIQDCNFGTVYISDVESLNHISQYQLYKVIHSKGSTVENLRNNKKTDVRIITGTNRELAPLVKNELFRKDLYYSINALTLNVPPLRDRKQDIEGIVRNYLKQFTKEYTTHLTINEEAMKEIREYTWEGNMIQLKSFCERLFVTTYKKNIDQGMVIGLLEELYPYVKEIDGEERIVIYKDPEAKEIVEALKKYDGNRKAVAQELDISTTTLWRRMNKYGISNNFMF